MRGLLAEHGIERPHPVTHIRLFSQAVRLQKIAQLAMSAHDAKRYVTGRQLIMKIVQHSRAR
jgi:hypothetical protein